MDIDCLFTDSNILNIYLYGGYATVTLEAPSGNSHTYMYLKPRDTEAFPPDVRFVYCLHDGTTKFYLGMLEQDRFRLTKNSRFQEDTDIVKGARYIEKLRKNQNILSRTPMKIYHNCRCGKCNRLLTDEKYIHIGFGKKCYKKLQEQTLFSEYLIPGNSFVGKFLS